jgi:RHS repeat-associated protein
MAAGTASDVDATDPAQAQLGPTAPQLNLPKGGGAIRGIDEKFAANPMTGASSLTVPIAISPGRSGFMPQLSLSYNSGSANNIFGMGWGISLPTITRRTDRGIPRYRDSEESDIFVLSSAEDLVPVLVRNAADEIERDGYCVKRYRPRIEGLFARIERWTRIADGDIHWRSFSKENVLTVYGIDGASRIADSADPTHVFSWLACQSYDDKGNAILYDHAAENDDGVDLAQANERNRTRSANRYPKRIRYGNRRPLLLDAASLRRHVQLPARHTLDAAEWLFDIVFDYGEGHYREQVPGPGQRVLAQAGIDPQQPWLARKDPFSSYRSGFEIRSYRLCRRILIFHHFPDEMGSPSCLVRSTAFDYSEKNTGSFITRIVQSGHKLLPDQRYLTRSWPPLDLGYSASPLEDPAFEDFQLHEVAAEGLANFPGGLDASMYRWLDFDSEGIPGVLTEQEDAWFYKPNIGNGRLGATSIVRSQPALAKPGGAAQFLMDVAGDGSLDLVDFSPAAAGFHGRSLDSGWTGFRTFLSLPVRDWNDPNLRFVDLTGDGVADVLVTEDDALTWHPSLLQDGFGPGLRVRSPLDEEMGPRAVFADPGQTIYLADMSGDGLSDILRIRNGEICYWPNLGYGRFGAKVTMDRAPRLDQPDQFDQSRIRLADTDGSGTTDLLYLGRDGVKIFLNQAGNGWSSARHLRRFPAIDNVASVMVTDFLGRGTSCLLWSSPLAAGNGRQLRYVDLMCGQKPHLLTRSVNNMGAETRIEYASSTEYYLADRAAGTPWVTRLPFPVHVVKRVETYDYVSRSRAASRYAYHHGFYDGIEREFRGFGRVDKYDTEEFAVLSASSNFPAGANIDKASSVPPVLTKTWSHTGAFLHGALISRHLAQEYYCGGDAGAAIELEDTILPPHLSADEAREACRALKGMTLRQEIYALDDKEESGRPYTVAENNYTVRILQHKRNNRHAVFFTHAREALNGNYERKLYPVEGRKRADPRVSHSVTLETDDYGNVLKSMAVAYGRRFPETSPLLTEDDRKRQAQILLTLTENSYTNAVREDDAYRKPVAAETRLYELSGMHPPRRHDGAGIFFLFHELAEKVRQASDGKHDLPYEDGQTQETSSGHPCRRLLKQTRNIYRSNRLDRLLPPGALESLALPGDSYTLAFTPSLLEHVFQPPATLLPDAKTVLGSKAADGGGYVDLDGDGRWWIPGGKVFFHSDPDAGPAAERDQAAAHFFLPRRFENAFGHSSTVDFDSHDVLMIRTVDAVGNTVTAENDYRVQQPRLLSDANGNRSEVAFDTLGLVAGTAIMGKTTENLGDSLAGFSPDLTALEIEQFFADPQGPAARALLGSATARMVYDQERFYRTGSARPEAGQPAFAATLSRETHLNDLAPGNRSRILPSFSYSDGFGREIQKKMQAEPESTGDAGSTSAPRWIGSGWTVFNNKSQPVRQYEPFFDDSHDFRFDMQAGVSPVQFYDPVGRVVATLNPDHSWKKTVFDPWRQESWDVNDTVLASDPGADRDVGDHFRRLPQHDYLPGWYQQRATGALGKRQQEAARKSSMHAGTPALAYFDALGRMILNIAHNRTRRDGASHLDPLADAFYSTRTLLDIEGNQRAVMDAKSRTVLRCDFGPGSNRLHQASMEAGERWVLNDVSGNPVHAWDSRGHQFRNAYDPLRRLTDSFLQRGSAEILLLTRTVYGETRPQPELGNLRGKPVQVFDQAGVVASEAYDFKGNLLLSRRRLAQEYKQILDWSGAVPLEDGGYASSTSYDALNRPREFTKPDQSVIRPIYNRANQLARVELQLHATAAATPLVKDIRYDAKGQRTLIEYGNGASSRYEYDPLTFRLVRLASHRSQAAFPGDCPHPAPPGWPGCQLQNLEYTYDPTGNITHIRDSAQQAIYFRNRRVSPGNDYTYDAIYRLIEGSGREHLGQAAAPHPHRPHAQPPLPHPGDGNAMARYVEQYLYDETGNMLAVQRRGDDPAQPGWKRTYSYQESSQLEPGKNNNRLSSTLFGGTLEPYRYDGPAGLHGDMTAMPHLSALQWDCRDQLQASTRQHSSDSTPETTWYVYDGGGERIRKVTERHAAAGQACIRQKERIYLGGFEIYREYDGQGAVSLERETLHITDDKRRVALVESRTRGSDQAPEQLLRYQLSNHLGSASVELDQQARIISYEEYSPYGSTTYQAVRAHTETPKRYRYTGKERDEENGLYYHGARYCASWLARWLNPDPKGMVDGSNLYAYAAGNPITYVDPTGTECDPAMQSCVDPSEQTSREEAEQRCIPAEHPTDQGPPADGGSSSGSTIGGDGPALGGMGYGLILSAPPGFTLQVPNSYDGVKMSAYREGVFNGEIGRNAGRGFSTTARRTSPGQVEAREIFGDLLDEPTDPAPGGRGWAKDHIIELQHDLTGERGLSPFDYRWQDSALNSLEGSQSWNLQRNNPLHVPAGGVARVDAAGRWYNSEGYRSGVRGVGEVFLVIGAIQTADHLADAVDADIRDGTGGTQTARAAATEGGGWAGACYGGEIGAEAGLMCGEAAPICSPIGGLIMGGIGYHYGSAAVDKAIDVIPSQQDAESFVGWLDWHIWDLYGASAYR